jgi:dihydroorotate dehydrogenase electron transfer subunit
MIWTETCGTPAAYERATIVAHTAIAENIFRIRVECPGIAPRALPGQFAMLRLADRSDPLLARPLAFYDVVDPDGGDLPRQADFVYLRHGKFTTALAGMRPGDDLVIWGPLGNGFDPPPVERLVLVAGGIGQTALLCLARERSGRASFGTPRRAGPVARQVTLLWGARHAGSFGDVEDFRSAGCDVHLATIDGSAGHKGTVVDLMDAVLRGPDAGTMHVACCGPEPMMAAVAGWCSARDVGCSVSLEEPMACGVGICFTCVARVRDAAGGWDYRRTCVEGPVFPASSIVWGHDGDDAIASRPT